MNGWSEEVAGRVEPGWEGATDLFFEMESPLGRVYVAVGPGGVRHLAPAGSAAEFVRDHGERFGRLASPADEEWFGVLREKIEEVLAGKRAELPLDLSPMTPFQRRVMRAVRDIPRGEVRPYGWVAREADAPGASRAVGNVMANNPFPLLVPCHRVIRSDGRTGSYGFGAGKKVRLLKAEGVPVEELARAPYVAAPATGIVCHATCRNARGIHPENRHPFRGVKEAESAGYRPCRVCRPVA